jgi:hypothetical protein
MSASPLVSWKRDPPQSAEEARAASLLRSMGPAPVLPPATIERIAHRAHLTVRAQRARALLRRRTRLGSEAHLASMAAALALAGILAAFIWLLIDLAAR